MDQERMRRSTSPRASHSALQRRALTRSVSVPMTLALLTSAGVIGGAGATYATVPGMPGVTQPGTQVYLEDFENPTADHPITIGAYSGGAAANFTTYTASPGHDGQFCNGWVMSWNDPPPAAGLDDLCTAVSGNGHTGWDNLRMLAAALGEFGDGESQVQAQDNHALTEFT